MQALKINISWDMADSIPYRVYLLFYPRCGTSRDSFIRNISMDREEVFIMHGTPADKACKK
jgi:hypothetical protein